MSHALNKRERLEEIELFLMRCASGATALEIADRFGISKATAHRDLNILIESERIPEPEAGRYNIPFGETISNVRLHPNEALMIYLALRRTIRITSHAPGFMISAIQKVIPALINEQLIQSVNIAVNQLEHDYPASEEQTVIWRTLIDGWRDQRVVRIEYMGRSYDKPKIRHIEIYLFEPMPFGDGIYLIAWNHERNGLRTYKPERIQRAMLTGETFTPRDDLDINTLLRHAMGIWYGEDPVQIELIFRPEVASVVMESKRFPTEEKHIRDDGWLHWQAHVVGWLEILSWVRGWGYNVKVLNPPELRQRIIDDLRKTEKLYRERQPESND